MKTSRLPASRKTRESGSFASSGRDNPGGGRLRALAIKLSSLVRLLRFTASLALSLFFVLSSSSSMSPLEGLSSKAIWYSMRASSSSFLVISRRARAK